MIKVPQIFVKTPKHKKFNYTPRFYDPGEEERTERENRIRQELEAERRRANNVKDEPAGGTAAEEEFAYRARMSGSFRSAKKTRTVQADPSANLLRLLVVMILVIGFIAYLQFGSVVLYVLAFIFFPLYFYLKFRRPGKN